MKKYFFIGLVFYSIKLNAQTNFKIYSEIAQGATYFLGDALFLDTDVNLGGQFNTSKGIFSVYGKYRFGQYIFTEITPFTFRYSAIGLGLKYRLFVAEKKVSPFARLDFSTEIKPNRSTSEFELSNYYSTPFFGELLLGIDIQLFKNLNLNYGMGVDVRSMKTNENISKTEQEFIHGIKAQLGVSYTFSVKKNKEIKTE